MSTSFDRYQKRKLISSYFSVVISIALVLFLLGCLGLLVLNAKKVADHFREQVVVTILQTILILRFLIFLKVLIFLKKPLLLKTM